MSTYSDMIKTGYTFDYDATRNAEIVTHPNGLTRAVIRVDECADAPEFDYAYPVFRVGYHYDYNVTFTGCGDKSLKASGVDDAEGVLTSFVQENGREMGVELFSRYLAAFHGGAAKLERSDSGDTYVSFGTRAMLEYWGCASDMAVEPDAGEWLDYANGDVFTVEIETRELAPESLFTIAGIDDMSERLGEWEDTGEIIGGAYGEDGAYSLALDMMGDSEAYLRLRLTA